MCALHIHTHIHQWCMCVLYTLCRRFIRFISTEEWGTAKKTNSMERFCGSIIQLQWVWRGYRKSSPSTHTNLHTQRLLLTLRTANIGWRRLFITFILPTEKNTHTIPNQLVNLNSVIFIFIYITFTYSHKHTWYIVFFVSCAAQKHSNRNACGSASAFLYLILFLSYLRCRPNDREHADEGNVYVCPLSN